MARLVYMSCGIGLEFVRCLDIVVEVPSLPLSKLSAVVVAAAASKESVDPDAAAEVETDPRLGMDTGPGRKNDRMVGREEEPLPRASTLCSPSKYAARWASLSLAGPTATEGSFGGGPRRYRGGGQHVTYLR
jgi:hypothetical protein